jgi:8-amino-7-oxononanoate synthase
LRFRGHLGIVSPMSTWREELAARLADWRAAGLERQLRVAAGTGVRLTVEGRAVLSFASNDYLGLSADPRVVEAARAALDAGGTGATASRLICGTRPEHARLEAALAQFKRSEAALVFASGYHAALATITALAGSGEGCAVILDRLVHACLIDGARLSGARVRAFRHNDVADLREMLARETRRAKDRPGPRVLVVVESLYSMDGDVAPLAEIHSVTSASGAWLLVDEAHATGVLGAGGRGLLSDVFPGPLPEDVLALGTLSKALGSQGGFLCAKKLVIETLVQSARAFLFSTGLAPAAAAAACRALELLAQGEERRLGLLARAEELRARLRGQGWQVLGGPGPILPVLVGDEARTMELARRLWEQNLWVPAVRFPTVKKGAARLRVSLSAGHSAQDLDTLCAALGDGGRA